MEVLLCTPCCLAYSPNGRTKVISTPFIQSESQWLRQVLSHSAEILPYYNLSTWLKVQSLGKSVCPLQLCLFLLDDRTSPPSPSKLGENVEELLLSSKEQTKEIHLVEREWRMLGLSLY